MRPSRLVTRADLIVVGSGLAGLCAALAAADSGANVIVLTAGAPLSGSSPKAQGGIAAAIGADDTPALHAADTRAVGAGLNDRRAVEVLVTAGKTEVRDLLAAGVPFDGGPAHPALGLEAGHSRRRVVHAEGAATGHCVTSAILARAVAHPHITIRAHMPAEQLITDGTRVMGVRSGGAEARGRAVVLATGGYAALFARNTNAPESQGQGLALAWQVGASLADLEFVQFHPTATALPGHPAFLLSEALRGEGALLLDGEGQQVVNPLLPRDQVARAIFRHLRECGPVYLSLRHLDPNIVPERFSSLAVQLAAWGLDLARDPIPVAPAAHYCMGGVRTDEMGRTDVPGLYVAGEAACTGAQGANRLASNSLLECLVFGRLAAQAALDDGRDARASWKAGPLPPTPGVWDDAAKAAGASRDPWGCDRPDPSDQVASTADAGGPQAVRENLDQFLGVERAQPGLETLVTLLSSSGVGCGESLLPGQGAARGKAPLSSSLLGQHSDYLGSELSEGAYLGRASRLVALLAARGALLRRESRGAHYRLDYPNTDPAWQGRILWQRDLPPRLERIE